MARGLRAIPLLQGMLGFDQLQHSARVGGEVGMLLEILLDRGPLAMAIAELKLDVHEFDKERRLAGDIVQIGLYGRPARRLQTA